MSRLTAKTLGALALVSSASGLQLAANHSIEVKDQNLCIKGHIAPELFLLGVPKGGSTSFYEDFVRSSGISNFMPDSDLESWRVKEAWVFAPQKQELAGRKGWLSHFEKCEQGTRKVALDATPAYFGCPNSPKNVDIYYGGTGVAPKLKFMVFLRDPVSRTHSHYYHYVENGVRDGAFNDAGCPAKAYPKTFAKAVESILNNGKLCHECSCNDVFSHSMYPYAFQRWFHYFSPSQFYVLPFHLAVTHKAVQYTWGLLGIPHGTGTMKSLADEDGGGVNNHHEYPTMKQDLPDSLNRKFRWHMEKKAGAHAVAKVLAHKSVNLYEYTGSNGDTSAISHWLSSNWGA